MFSVLRRAQFRRIFFAQSISTLGDNIAPIAVTFAVLASRHSATDVGLVLAARTLPMAVFLIFGGAWADRLSRKRLMVVSDLVRFGSQGVFALLLLIPDPSLWLLLLVQAVNGTATAFFRPASSGLVQEAVPSGERQQANALLSSTSNLSAIVGPALAAILIATAGNAWAVGADAISFLLSAVFLVGLVLTPREPRQRIGILREIGEGLRAVRERGWIGVEILGFCQFQLFVLACYGVLGPIVAEQDYTGAATWAWVTSFAGVGALVGDAVSLRIRPKRPLVTSGLFCIACLPLLLGLAFGTPLPVLVGFGFLFGIGLSVPNTLWFTALQDHVPEHLMSRVSSLDWMGSMVLRPVGQAVVAPIAALVGPAVVLVTSTGVTLATVVGIMLDPRVRRLRGGPPPGGAGETA